MTYVRLQSTGKTLVERLSLNMNVSEGASSLAPFLRIWFGRLALLVCRFLSNFSTPSVDMVSWSISGCLLLKSSGSVVFVSSFVKTEKNCWFKISAFVALSWCRIPFFSSGAIPTLSVRRALTYFQKVCLFPV